MVVRKWITLLASAALLFSLVQNVTVSAQTDAVPPDEQSSGDPGSPPAGPEEPPAGDPGSPPGGSEEPPTGDPGSPPAGLEQQPAADIEATAGLIDPLDDFSRVHQRSNLYIDGANPAYYGGDTKRVTRATVNAGFLIYKTDYDIHSFTVYSYFFTAVPIVPLRMLVSADGTDYAEVASSVYLSGEPTANWQLYAYEATDLPAGSKYLKIELSGDSRAWSPQVSKVAINLNTLSVNADPPAGTIAGEPLAVSLTTPTVGASVYYRMGADEPFQTYSEPLSLTSFTRLETFAVKDGLEPSPVRTYTYFSREDMVVDRFGQMMHVDFPGKVTSEEELEADVAADEAYYGGLQAPDEFDEYGGLTGSKETLGLEATGFFHIGQASGKPVLVTPAGTAYFSLGVNGITNNETFTMVAGRENIYEWIPDYNSEYRNAFTGSKDNFSFYMANKYRKTGTFPTIQQFYAEAVERLRLWGFNSAGAWGYGEYARQNNLPYTLVLPLNGMAKPAEVKVFDIFAPDAEQRIDEAFARSLPALKDDPLLIGYFVDNEYHYEKFITAVPKLKASQAALKSRLVQMLQEKYVDIAAFNESWGTSFGSFSELNEAPLYIDTAAASADIEQYFRLYLNTYYETVTRLFRKYDPNHLLLGDRWLTLPMQSIKVRGILAEEAGKYMDVISINHYDKNLNVEMLNDIHSKSGGKPILLSEWSYGIPEQGLDPIVPGSATNEQERQWRYRNYVEGAAALGYVVGAHWFNYVDQAATGRWFEGEDGERYNTGLINVADRPYKTFLDGVMETHNRIYDVLLAGAEPFHHDFGDEGPGPDPDHLTIDIPYTSEPIPIDGAVNGYEGEAGTATLTEADLVSGSGGEGMSAQYRFAWDEEHLYVTAEITDPTPMRNNNRETNIWRGDGVEMFFGPGELELGGDLQYYDRQIIMSASEADGSTFWYWFNTGRQPAIEMAAQPFEGGGGYVLEAAIPWSAVNVVPAENGELLFDFGFDDSEDGNTRSRQWIWNGTNRNNLDRGLWGKAKLTKEEAEPETVKVDYTGDRLVTGTAAAALSAKVTRLQGEDGQSLAPGLPIRFEVNAVNANGALTPVDVPALRDPVLTNAEGIAAVSAALPAGLYQIRAKLLENPHYVPAEAGSELVVRPATVLEVKFDGYVRLPQAVPLFGTDTKLNMDVEIKGKSKDEWLIWQGTRKLDIKTYDWVMTTKTKAYFQGRGTLNGKSLTVRIMSELRKGEPAVLSVQMWEGSDTFAEPVLELFTASYYGKLTIG